MTWGAVAAAVGTVVMGSVNANRASDDAAANRAAGLAAAEIPTRTTGIENLLRELTSNTQEEGLTSESQSILDELMQDESFQEQLATQQENVSTVQRGDEASQAALADRVQGGDGQAQVDAMIEQILRGGKADISNVGTRTGSFGSTTEQLLTNDLIAKAASAGVGQQNILDAQQLQAIELAQQGTATETGTQTGTQDTTGTSTSEQVRQGTTDTTGSSSTDSTTTSAENQSSISDILQNPNDQVGVSGDLADLITSGIGGDPVTESAESRRARGLAALAGQTGPFSDAQIDAAAGEDVSTPLTNVNEFLLDANGNPLGAGQSLTGAGILEDLGFSIVDGVVTPIHPGLANNPLAPNNGAVDFPTAPSPSPADPIGVAPPPPQTIRGGTIGGKAPTPTSASPSSLSSIAGELPITGGVKAPRTTLPVAPTASPLNTGPTLAPQPSSLQGIDVSTAPNIPASTVTKGANITDPIENPLGDINNDLDNILIGA